MAEEVTGTVTGTGAPGTITFEAVYDEWYDRIYKYAFTLLLNKEDAEDVTADTFVSAYQNFLAYDASKGSMGAWLMRIAHNRAVNLMRSSYRTRRAELPQDWQDSALRGDDDFTRQIEDAETVLKLYARLEIKERELLNLRCVLGLKDKEIGELLGLAEKTVNKRYHRLLTKCRMILNSP